jgi:subtilase family serine protease
MRMMACNRTGISEIVSTLLMLVITVILFTSVALWVTTYPRPEARTISNFDAQLDGQTVNIKHLTGETLIDETTQIIITIDDTSNSLKISDGLNGDTTWNIGEVWSYTDASITSSSVVQIAIVDLTANEVIFDCYVQRNIAGVNDVFEIFTTYAEPNMVPPDSTTIFKIYAYVGYYSGLIPKDAVVTVDLSHVGGSTSEPLYYNSNGWYETVSLTIPVGTSSGIKSLVVTATHNTNTAQSVCQLIVEQPDLTLTSNDIQFSDDTPTEGETITITATIHNEGGSPSTSAIVWFYYDYTNLIGSVNIGAIPVDGSTDASIDWVTVGGLHIVYVEITDVVPEELYVDNNNATKPIRVRSTRYLHVESDLTGYKQLVRVQPDESNIQELRQLVESAGEYYIWSRFIEGSVGRGGCNVRAVDLGDLDGDGDVDCVIATSGGYIYWYENPGGTKTRVYSRGIPFLSIVIGDLDADGDLDIVSGTSTGHVFRHINDGTGSFSNYYTGRLWGRIVVSLAISDLTDDGLNDIVVGAKARAGVTPRVYYYENQGGTGNWESEVNIDINPGSDVLSISADDLDDDGLHDVVAGTSAGVIYWYENQYPNPSWIRTPIESSAGSSVNSVDIGQIGGSAAPDVVAGTSAGVIYWYRNSDWAQTIIESNAGSSVNTISLGDIGGAARLDVVAGTSAGVIYWYDNSASWPRTTIETNAGSSVNSVSLGDIAGDSALDVVGATSDSKLYGYINSAWTRIDIDFVTSPIESVAINDMDGDGDNDIVIGTRGWHVEIYKNDGTGSTWTRQTVDVEVNAFVWTVAVADIDSDTDIDIVIGTGDWGTQYHRVYLYTNDGTGAFSRTMIESNAGAPVFSIALGDIAGDSLVDIAYGTIYRYLYIQRNDGTGWSKKTIANVLYQRFRDIELGDVDGDSDLDIICGIQSTNTGQEPHRVCYYENPASWMLPWSRVDIDTNPGDGVFSVTVGDIDLDTDYDIIAGLRGSSTGKKIYFYRNEGSWTRISVDDNTGGTVWSVKVGDLDDDNTLEIVAGTSGRKVYLYKTLDTGSTWQRSFADLNVGSAARSIALSDLDGDTDLDIVTSSWWQHRIYWYANKCIGRFITPAYTTNMDISGTWTFRVYGRTSGGITGVLYVNVYKGDGTLLFTASTTENIGSKTSWYLFTWDYTYTGTLSAGDRLYVEVWISASVSATNRYFRLGYDYTTTPSAVVIPEFESTSTLSSDATLSETDISFSDDTPTTGESVVISATVSNGIFLWGGGGKLVRANVNFYDGVPPTGTLIDIATVRNIPRGGSKTVNVTWTPTTPGTHTIYVEITDVIPPDSNPSNNRASRNINVLPGLTSDLEITSSDIVFTPSSPVIKDSVTITATVHNVGSVTSTSANVSFYNNSVLIDTKPVTDIPSGSSKNISVVWIPAKSGLQTIRVEIKDVVPFDSNSSNNDADKDITVRSPDLKITSSDIVFMPSSPVIKDSVTITATVHNVGDATATSATVEFYDGNTQIGGTTVTDISPGNSKSTSISWIPIVSGWHTIHVKVLNVDPGDSDSSNNEASKNIKVRSPDLKIERLDAPWFIRVGRWARITVTVKNIGDATATRCTVKFYDGSRLIGIRYLYNINPDESKRTYVYWRAWFPIGWHTIKVNVENVEPGDSDMTNNDAIKRVYVYWRWFGSENEVMSNDATRRYEIQI